MKQIAVRAALALALGLAVVGPGQVQWGDGSMALRSGAAVYAENGEKGKGKGKEQGRRVGQNPDNHPRCEEHARRVIAQSNQTLRLRCNGDTTVITGHNNTIYLSGRCDAVIVRGGGNTVYVERVDLVAVAGNDNRVFWESGVAGSPDIYNRGRSNTIRQRAFPD